MAWQSVPALAIGKLTKKAENAVNIAQMQRLKIPMLAVVAHVKLPVVPIVTTLVVEPKLRAVQVKKLQSALVSRLTTEDILKLERVLM